MSLFEAALHWSGPDHAVDPLVVSATAERIQEIRRQSEAATAGSFYNTAWDNFMHLVVGGNPAEGEGSPVIWGYTYSLECALPAGSDSLEKCQLPYEKIWCSGCLPSGEAVAVKVAHDDKGDPHYMICQTNILAARPEEAGEQWVSDVDVNHFSSAGVEVSWGPKLTFVGFGVARFWERDGDWLPLLSLHELQQLVDAPSLIDDQVAERENTVHPDGVTLGATALAA